MFGFAPFNSYIFIRLRPGWGGAGCYGADILRNQNGEQIITPAIDVFRGGEKLFVISILPYRTALAVLFFYILSQPVSAITMSRLLSLIALKLVAELLCFFYYPSGQVFDRGEHHTQIMP